MSDNDKIPWRNVPENHGGTFYFETGYQYLGPWSDINQIHRIGTFGCIICIAAYFKIDEERAFCAHIQARGADLNQPWVITDEAEGARLKQMTIRKLQQEAEQHDWQPADVDPGSVTIVAPNIWPDTQHQQQVTSTGRCPSYYAVEGITDFLELDPSFPIDERSDGFIIDHVTTVRQAGLSVNVGNELDDRGVVKCEVDGYVAVVQMGLRDWCFNADGDIRENEDRGLYVE